MKKIKVPDRYNYIAVFLTLRCNLNCPYCINALSPLVRDRKEMNHHEWTRALNRLEIKPDLPITLEGGEPTLHKGVYKIINEVNHTFDLLTNLQFDVCKFVENAQPEKFHNNNCTGYKSIRASYHPTMVDAVNLIRRAKILIEEGYEVGVFSLNYPGYSGENMQMTEIASGNGVFFYVKDFLGRYEGRTYGYFKYPKGVSGCADPVRCRTKELLIDPAGNVFRCHRDLYANENPIGHILDEDFEIKDEFRSCELFGQCSPCDVKLKTNRFLQMGSCSVEIE